MTITPEQAARRAADGLAPQRDPGRIAPILADLARYWHAHPDMRLGQIVVSAIGAHGVPDVFYPEDDRPAAWLAKAAADCPPAPDLRALVEEYGAAECTHGVAVASGPLDMPAPDEEAKVNATKAALLAAIDRLRQPARDEATPVAWRYRRHADYAWRFRDAAPDDAHRIPAMRAAGFEIHPLYDVATPAASQAERVPCAGWVLRANGRWYLAAGDYEARAVPADVTASPRDLDAGPGRWDVSIPEFGRRRILRTDEGEPDDLAPSPLTPPATLRLAMFAAEDAIAELCTAGLRAIGR